MTERLSQGIFRFDAPVSAESYACAVGKLEGEGPLGSCFDEIIEDSRFGQETWEQAESQFQLEAASLAIRKAGLTKEDIDIILAGDLVNQCTSSTFGLFKLNIPYLGIFGACSTMAEGLLIASLIADSGAAQRTAAVTSSHFSTAQRQFRAPLSYGGQSTPTSQHTCTGAGAVILSHTENKPGIAGGCIGKTADLGIRDMTNMGAAMAPAAAETIRRWLNSTGTSPADYDCIITGDLGTVGSKLLLELMEREGIDISGKHLDCGAMIYDNERQGTICGGSGCGCSASVLTGYFLPMLERGEMKSFLFTATGALMSPLTSQQGQSIPAIAHLVHFVSQKGV